MEFKANSYFDKVLNYTKGTFSKIKNNILRPGIITITTDHTLNINEHGLILEASGTLTITLPSIIIEGFNCSVVNKGAGTITFVVESGSLHSTGITLTTQYKAATVYKSPNQVWTLIGGVE